MKRKSTIALCTRSKKPKLCDHELPLPVKKKINQWVSATHTRNFMLNDSLVDWLKYSTKSKYSTCHTNYELYKKENFTTFIMKQGNTFETKLIEYINEHKIHVVTVSDSITKESLNQTISLMEQGIPVIHSAPVRNSENKTQGIIDLLVRSDYLDKIVEECPLAEDEKFIYSPGLNKNYYYVVIDIKFSTLPLRSNGIHLLNSGSYPAYKAQTLIYTQSIGKIQGYTSRYAYILGRRWKYTKKDIPYSNYSCMDKLGVIDYKEIDKNFVLKTQNAIKWIQDVRKNGHTWSTNPPSRLELYPNMCCDSGKWQQEKEKIANDIGEISNIWYCGVKHRENCLKKGINSWKDPKCVSSIIGMSGVRGSIIDKILDINRQNTDKIRPKNIPDILNWKTLGNEIFVDFETMSDVFTTFSDLPEQKSSEMIFMIGVYWKNKENWEYKNFICKSQSLDEEYRIMDEFNNFIKEKRNPKMWYWCAEKSFWKRAKNRQYNYTKTISNLADKKLKLDRISNIWKVDQWFDMCQIFKQTPIVIKDCFKFGLKPISSAMRKHGLIKIKIDSNCSSGLTAMVEAWKCYKDFDDPVNCSVMKDIEKYNKFDVSVLYEILKYFRINHI